MSIRHVIEAVQRQGTDECIVYSVTVTPWGSAPTSASLSIFEKVAGVWQDRTTTLTTAGAVTVLGDVITLPGIQSVQEGHNYLAVTKFTLGANVQSCIFEIQGEK